MSNALPDEPRRRILVSAFACSPVWGSEPGVGWQWAVELSKRYDVVLVTHAYFRGQIQEYLRQLPSRQRPEGLQLEFFQPREYGVHPHKVLNSRLFYTLWQWRVRSLVRQLCKTHKPSLIHHLTWGTFRFPCFLGGLGVPLVMGPLGGGDVAPMRLYEGLPRRERLREGLRALSLAFSRFDPLIQHGLRHAELLFCKTDGTLRSLPPHVQSKARLGFEIGAPGVVARQTASQPQVRPFRLLYAGRLIGLKGVLLLLGTARLLVQAGHAIELHIAGDGPLRVLLERNAADAGITSQVTFLGKLNRPDLMQRYSEADLFFFPSLHDSSGNVVLEALSRGLPVLCLDLGGPKHYVTPQCGIVVETGGRSRSEVEQAFAAAITGLIHDPQRLATMSRSALAHAEASNWQACVRAVYATIEEHFGWSRGNHSEPHAGDAHAVCGRELV